MTSIEQSVKAQFAKVFSVSDWPLFKMVADSNLEEAAKLKKNDFHIRRAFRLLARNSRKRLLIGVGVELLLKAVYLKHGYAINRPPSGHALRFLFLAADATGVRLLDDKTFMLNDLINHLSDILDLRPLPFVVCQSQKYSATRKATSSRTHISSTQPTIETLPHLW